jgi:hypothetical protein
MKLSLGLSGRAVVDRRRRVGMFGILQIRKVTG